MTLLLLTILAFCTASLHLWSEYWGPSWGIYLAKPLTTTLILLIAVLAPAPVSAFYQSAIVVGLVFSLIGDILLMLPTDRFIMGLVSFLIAHLWYSAAFGSIVGWRLSLWGVPILVYAFVIYGRLAPYVSKVRAPILVYLVAITLMAWLAVTLFVQQHTPWTLQAASGASLFVVSDSVLALNRFRRPFRSAQLIILGSYYLAQWLIARSV